MRLVETLEDILKRSTRRGRYKKEGKDVYPHYIPYSTNIPSPAEKPRIRHKLRHQYWTSTRFFRATGVKVDTVWVRVWR